MIMPISPIQFGDCELHTKKVAIRRRTREERNRRAQLTLVPSLFNQS